LGISATLPSDYQLHLFHEGNLFESHELLGAHIIKLEQKKFTKFSVWAPNALEVRIVGDFNGWKGEGYSLHKVNDEGIWMITIEQNLVQV